MDDYESLSHTKWECKYHVVFIPKCRRKTLYAELIPPPYPLESRYLWTKGVSVVGAVFFSCAA
jgi:REP element-mobilizing transposase RayT